MKTTKIARTIALAAVSFAALCNVALAGDGAEHDKAAHAVAEYMTACVGAGDGDVEWMAEEYLNIDNAGEMTGDAIEDAMDQCMKIVKMTGTYVSDDGKWIVSHTSITKARPNTRPINRN